MGGLQGVVEADRRRLDSIEEMLPELAAGEWREAVDERLEAIEKFLRHKYRRFDAWIRGISSGDS